MMAGFIREKDGGLVFPVRVLPRSSVNAVVGLQDGAVKIKLKAPPVGGAANRMCIQFLAKTLGLPKSSVEIQSGETGRSKQIMVRPREAGSREELARLREVIEGFAKG
ncbi:MAG: YggU family protein [Desulfatibacillum sp.]|nr:YggU family protein [Desulfatibacillum sp.]